MSESYQNFRDKQQSFTTSDGVIRYIDQGDGEVLLLLHGVPASSWLYRKIIPIITRAGYRVIAPDMLGYGNSGNPDGYDLYNPANHARRLLELMDGLGIANWHHVMHDGGGLWTWEMLKSAPERARCLIMLNTIIYEEGFHPPMRMEPGLIAKISMWMYRNGVTTGLLLKSLFREGLKKNILSKEEVEGYRKPLLEGKTHSLYYFFTQTCNKLPDNDAVIRKVKVPVAVIWGKHDDMLQWEPQKEKVMEAMHILPEDVHVIDAKHFIQEEKPEEVAQIILEFVGKSG
ncbi:MAG: alpha/beta hydrolase [Bacteroidota bacterium]